ncbi:hypothetical protein [Streptomyces sp. O3]
MNRPASKALGRVVLALGAALASTPLCTTVSTAAPGGASGSAGIDSATRTGSERACPVVHLPESA